MKRKLSRIEHILDGNLVCFVRLEGSINLDQLRSAIGRVQRKHPALRALIREETDGLYYEADAAREIPLRIVQRVADDDYRRECETELTTEFPYNEPQLRVVWMPGELEADLVFATSHRICDGMSLLIIVKEVLRCLCSQEELVPYEAITTQDIIGDYQPPRGWKRKLTVALINGMLPLVPNSRRVLENKDHHLEWSAGRPLSDSLRQRCKAEGVSVHAALVVALDRALLAVLGDKSPKWIDNQIDPRRGRFAALKTDMLFLGGGGFKVLTGQSPDVEFWARARGIHQDMPKQIEQEILKIPARFHFFEMLRPITPGQVQSIMRINDAFRLNGKLNSFALSNWGNIEVIGSDAPFRLKDFRVYVHSFKTKVLGMIPYTFNGEMHFYCVSHKNCMNPSQMEALMRKFMTVLREQAVQSDESGTESVATCARETRVSVSA
jgi:hypothetical protein